MDEATRNAIRLLEIAINNYETKYEWCRDNAAQAGSIFGQTVSILPGNGYALWHRNDITAVSAFGALIVGQRDLGLNPDTENGRIADTYDKSKAAVLNVVGKDKKGRKHFLISQWSDELEGTDDECQQQVIDVFRKAAEMLRSEGGENE